jgi:enoyl-CoA hydratase/carnithine racemase
MHDLIIEERPASNGKRVAIATLNAPKSLHALTLDMIRQLDSALIKWESDQDIVCVVLQSGTDKAFCAGGDVRGLRASILDAPDVFPNPAAQAFFSEEYRLDYRIHRYAKPIVVWGGGIVMGGGVGLMAGARHRVVTESTRIAMPEISIGLFPDVGGSWFLPRMPGCTGLFLALTGAPLNAADALFAGLGDYFIRQQNREEVIRSLCEADWQGEPDDVVNSLLRQYAAPAEDLPVSEVRMHFDQIQALCSSSKLQDVLTAIAAYEGDSVWLQRAAKTSAAGSAFSAALGWEMQKRARTLSLAEAFRMELDAVIHCCAFPDFAEGVRALLIDKDNRPVWQSDFNIGAAVRQCFTSPWAVHPLKDLNNNQEIL